MALKLAADMVAVDDDYWALYEEFERKGWTDGLPVVPPTPQRVERMLAETDLKSGHIIGELPPRRANLTVENLAINAVMAGCRPEYFPVVVAIAEVIVQPEFDFFTIGTTTSGATELFLINGPIRRQLNVNCSYGILGPGFRANATIGRAVKLTERNVGGSIPGTVSKSTLGQPGRYGTLCFGELEEDSPWPPLHTTRGFKATDNTVTVHPALSTVNMVNMNEREAEPLLNTIYQSITYMGSNTYFHGGNDERNPSLIILCPDHAQVLAKGGGMSREDVQRYLFEHARRPLSDWHPKYHPKVTEQKSYRDGYVYLHNRPEQFLIAVAGGDGGHQSMFIPNFATLCRTITWPIRLKGEGTGVR